MKILITSQGKTLESPVDPRFGRAKLFIVYDLEQDTYEAVDNSENLQASHGAGIQAAQRASELGAEYVLTGDCGPKASRTLSAAGVNVITGCDGTVKDVIAAFKEGRLK